MNIKIISLLNLIILQEEDTLFLEDYLKKLKTMPQDPCFNANFNYLHDFRKVKTILGGINDIQSIVDFSLSIDSVSGVNVIFLVSDNAPRIRQYVEGYILMVGETERNYKIYPESKIKTALSILGLNYIPRELGNET